MWLVRGRGRCLYIGDGLDKLKLKEQDIVNEEIKQEIQESTLHTNKSDKEEEFD